MAFAKLWETKVGQILVKIDSAESDEHEAEIRVYFEPEGLGVCSAAFSYKEWDAADEAFEKLDEALALEIVSGLMEKFGGLGK